MSDQTEGQGGAASARTGEETAAGSGGRSGEVGTPETTSPQAAEETAAAPERAEAGEPRQREVGREEAGAAASGRTPDDSGTTQTTAGDGTTRGAGEGAGETAGEGAAQTAAEGEGPAPLFGAEEGEGLRGHWEAVQAAFVDDPRAAVQRADALVVEVVEKLTSSFSNERSRLEAQWSQGEDVSTEDLRQSLRRYRSFFERLLRL